jgi:hypothetical protein
MTPSIQRSLVAVLIAIGILLAGFFGLRSMFAYREIRETVPMPPTPLAIILTEKPVETDVELIREWMTVPYIAMTYRVHPKILFDALGIPPKDNEEKNLLQLNDEYFPDEPGEVMTRIKATVHAYQPEFNKNAPAPTP